MREEGRGTREGGRKGRRDRVEQNDVYAMY